MSVWNGLLPIPIWYFHLPNVILIIWFIRSVLYLMLTNDCKSVNPCSWYRSNILRPPHFLDPYIYWTICYWIFLIDLEIINLFLIVCRLFLPRIQYPECIFFSCAKWTMFSWLNYAMRSSSSLKNSFCYVSHHDDLRTIFQFTPILYCIV